MSLGFAQFAELDTEISDMPSNNIPAPRSSKTGKRKPISNNKAAAKSRAGGAKTRSEIALESVIKGQDDLMKSQQKATKVKEASSKMITLMDKIGELPPEEAQSESTYNNVKNIVPNLTLEQYRSLADKSQKRATLTRQLSRLPVGTQLPEASLKKLKSVGIDNPNKYMSLSVTKPTNTIVGALQQTAINRAKAARKTGVSTFGSGAGEGLLSKQEDIAKSATESLALKDREKLMRIKSLSEGLKSGSLDERQRFTAIREIKNDLITQSKTADTLNQWFNNVRDFSSLDKSKSTLRLDDNFGELTGTGKAIVTKKSFQNINDIGLVYSLIKMLDPESVVREGEIKLANNSLGLLESLGVKVNNIFKGETLSPQQRAGILNVANKTFISGSRSLRENVKTADATAKRFGLESELAIPGSVRKIVKNSEVAEKAISDFEASQKPPEGTFKSVEEAERSGLRKGAVVEIEDATGRKRKAIIE